MRTASLSEFGPLAEAALPAAVGRIPSMMSAKERGLLFGLARDWYSGAGLIMDAGVFCGASTMCFGAGLRENDRIAAILARYPRPVRTFEYGVVNPGMLPFFARHGVTGEWAVGGSFEAYLRANIAPVADLVALTMGDILAQPWPGEPIELMFLDVVKSEAILRHVLAAFLPALLPGAILVQQDYFIDGLPFLKIAQEYLAPWFDYLGEIHSSAIFRVRAPLPSFLVARDPNDILPLEEKLALLDQARDRSVDEDRRLMCDLGKVRFLATIDPERADYMLADLRRDYPGHFEGEQRARIEAAIRIATNRVATAMTAPQTIDA